MGDRTEFVVADVAEWPRDTPAYFACNVLDLKLLDPETKLYVVGQLVFVVLEAHPRKGASLPDPCQNVNVCADPATETGEQLWK